MTLREERNRALGYAIMFFILMCMFGVLTHKSFSNGDLKFGIAMTALALLMAGTSTFCTRHFLICRHVEEIKKGKDQ